MVDEPRPRVVVGRARVDDDRLAQLARERELLLEEPLLRVVRRVVAVVVEARLPDRDDLRMPEQRAQLARARPGAPASCGCTPRHA